MKSTGTIARCTKIDNEETRLPETTVGDERVDVVLGLTRSYACAIGSEKPDKDGGREGKKRY